MISQRIMLTKYVHRQICTEFHGLSEYGITSPRDGLLYDNVHGGFSCINRAYRNLLSKKLYTGKVNITNFFQRDAMQFDVLFQIRPHSK
jgi:hypothetical protein